MSWKDEEKYLRWLDAPLGIVPAEKESAYWAQVDAITEDAGQLLFPYVRDGRLIFVFPYCLDEQQEPYNTLDGLTLSPKDKSGPHGIGISDHALQQGDDYAMGVLLHELAHIDFDGYGHGQEFIRQFKGFLDRFNEATGRSIQDVTDWELERQLEAGDWSG